MLFEIETGQFGELSNEDKTKLRDHFRKRGHARYLIDIQNLSGKRTISQNKLYWKWVHIVADDEGVTPTFLHVRTKIEVFGLEGMRKIEHKGKEIYISSEVPKSRDKSKTEFMALMKRIEEIANEKHLTLPYPDEL